MRANTQTLGICAKLPRNQTDGPIKGEERCKVFEVVRFAPAIAVGRVKRSPENAFKSQRKNTYPSQGLELYLKHRAICKTGEAWLQNTPTHVTHHPDQGTAQTQSKSIGKRAKYSHTLQGSCYLTANAGRLEIRSTTSSVVL